MYVLTVEGVHEGVTGNSGSSAASSYKARHLAYFA